MSTPLAEGTDVTRRFGSHTAVDRADLRVDAGEVVGLLGANGAGKTTLIRMLLGLLRPTAGTIRLFGAPPSRDTRRRLGYVPQGLGLYDDLTAVQNLMFARHAFGSGTTTFPPGISSAARVPVGRLPLGVQRRVAFAQALAHGPDLLVLDEPTSGVDALAAAELWDTIHHRAEADAGVLVTTHQMEEAEQCDRLVILAAGRVVAEGATRDVVGDMKVVEIETGDWTRALAAVETAGMTAALIGNTLRVPDVSPHEVERALGDIDARVRSVDATLEERFLQLAAEATTVAAEL